MSGQAFVFLLQPRAFWREASGQWQGVKTLVEARLFPLASLAPSPNLVARFRDKPS